MANTGVQFTNANDNHPFVMDLCDHVDSEKECDGKENGEADDLIKQEFNRDLVAIISNADLGAYTPAHYVFGHREIVTPPPEPYS